MAGCTGLQAGLASNWPAQPARAGRRAGRAAAGSLLLRASEPGPRQPRPKKIYEIVSVGPVVKLTRGSDLTSLSSCQTGYCLTSGQIGWWSNRPAAATAVRRAAAEPGPGRLVRGGGAAGAGEGLGEEVHGRLEGREGRRVGRDLPNTKTRTDMHARTHARTHTHTHTHNVRGMYTHV